MRRAYYSSNLPGFLDTDGIRIMEELRNNNVFKHNDEQEKAWRKQIVILQDQLRNLGSGHIMFEYTIPRMGKRVDTVLIYSDFVFVMEFKVNKSVYQMQDEDQCTDYALDLKNFHKESHCASIVPILVSTDAKATGSIPVKRCVDGVYDTIRTNKEHIGDVMGRVCGETPGCVVSASIWEHSDYKPTPTIMEAATALCSNISGLEDITRSGADAKNLGVTTDSINGIIDESKKNGSKSICFVTGVPGSGKTLAALKLVCDKQGAGGEQAVLLSGNETLVDVLKESLKKGGSCMEEYGGAAAALLIQHIPRFRDTVMGNTVPPERIIVFDEAQRAWSAAKLAKKIGGNRGPSRSDPDLIIDAMSRHEGWAVIVCLIGEGQEIYDGEVGLPGWLTAIRENHPEWRVYHSDKMEQPAYLTEGVSDILQGVTHKPCPELHLETSVRSFRGENLAKLVREILNDNADKARETWKDLKDRYPIVITRDIKKAKRWVREQARGTERYGVIASSGADRLRPHGIYVRSKIKPTKWFLAGKDDIRSSYYMEDTATEFYIQGLELDWVCLAWDANLRYGDGGWSHHLFHGDDWRYIKQEKNRVHLTNAYRVLMTRARQGMVIFVPEGDENDATRRSEFYDGTYGYLKDIGFDEV